MIRRIPSEITVELLFFVLFALAFIIAGFFILLASSVVVIDPEENLVPVARDFKVFKRVDKYALSEFHTVVYETDSEGANPTVALEGNSKRTVVIFVAITGMRFEPGNVWRPLWGCRS